MDGWIVWRNNERVGDGKTERWMKKAMNGCKLMHVQKKRHGFGAPKKSKFYKCKLQNKVLSEGLSYQVIITPSIINLHWRHFSLVPPSLERKAGGPADEELKNWRKEPAQGWGQWWESVMKAGIELGLQTFKVSFFSNFSKDASHPGIFLKWILVSAASEVQPKILNI